ERSVLGAVARVFGGEIEPVGSLSGFSGTPTGAFGGNGEDAALRLSGPVPIAGPAAAPFVMGFASNSAAGLPPSPAAPPGGAAEASGYRELRSRRNASSVSTLATFLAISWNSVPLAPIGAVTTSKARRSAPSENLASYFSRRRATPIDSSLSA